MIDALADVSWIAVLVAAVVWFVLGAAWYMTPAIARKWQQAGGIEVPDDASADPKMFALTFVAYVVAATVTAMLVMATGAAGAGGGAGVGFAVGVGYALT